MAVQAHQLTDSFPVCNSLPTCCVCCCFARFAGWFAAISIRVILVEVLQLLGDIAALAGFLIYMAGHSAGSWKERRVISSSQDIYCKMVLSWVDLCEAAG